MSEEQAVESQTVEEQARAQGWVPEEEYKGKSGPHKTAEEFLNVGKNISAVQSERNEKLLEQLSNQVAMSQQQMKEFAEAQRLELAAVKKDAYERAIAKLKEEEVKAVDEGDREKFLQVREKIENTKKPEDIKVEPKADPEMVEWAAKNTWYRDDPTMRDFADFIGKDISTRGNIPQHQFLDEVTRRVKAQYPDKFGVKKEIQDVEESSNGGGNKQKQSNDYKGLPADAKAACDKYIKAGLYKDKDAYCAEYYR